MDGNELGFITDFRPAAMFLYYHFVITLLRNKKNRQPGWEPLWAKTKTGHPWVTPGPYLRKSMLLQLARFTGDLKEDEELLESLCTDGKIFESKDRLNDREEAEVARRDFMEVDSEEDDDDDE